MDVCIIPKTALAFMVMVVAALLGCAAIAACRLGRELNRREDEIAHLRRRLRKVSAGRNVWRDRAIGQGFPTKRK